MKPDFYIDCLEPGADNPKEHAPVPAPEPPEGFVDNTVKVFRLNPDGSKGEFLGTMPAFPEGWDDPAKRKMTPGSGRRDKEEDEDMVRPKREAPPADELRRLYEKHNGKINRIARSLGTNWLRTKQWLIEAGIIEEQQTPEPEPAAAANQEPEQEKVESAEPSITPEETKEVTLPPKNDGFGPGDDEPIPYVPVDLRDLIAELREDLDLERKKVAALEKKMELLASALPAGSRTSQENRLAKLLVAVFRELWDAGTA